MLEAQTAINTLNNAYEIREGCGKIVCRFYEKPERYEKPNGRLSGSSQPTLESGNNNSQQLKSPLIEGGTHPLEHTPPNAGGGRQVEPTTGESGGESQKVEESQKVVNKLCESVRGLSLCGDTKSTTADGLDDGALEA